MLNITVGFVFTQLMFCDDQGKLQFHRAQTDVDKPWESVLKVLQLLKNALLLDAPKCVQPCFHTLQVRVDYKTVHFDNLLSSMYEALSDAYARSEIIIENWNQRETESIIEPILPNEPCVSMENDGLSFEHTPAESAVDEEASFAIQQDGRAMFGCLTNRSDIGLPSDKKRSIRAARKRWSVERFESDGLARGDPFPFVCGAHAKEKRKIFY